jgi:hypothetical protein
VNPSPCPTGHYCPVGTALDTSFPCPAGTFGPDEKYTNLDNCTICTAGMYCEADGLSAPTGNCWGGYFCIGGAASPTPVDHNVSILISPAVAAILYFYFSVH